MKKLVTLIRFILLFSLLAGCSGAPKVQGTPTPTQPAQEVTIVKTVLPENVTATPDSQLTQLLRSGGEPAPTIVQSEVTRKVSGGAIEVRFDQAMNPDTTAGAMQVTGPDGVKVPGKVTWPEASLLRFQPDQALQPGSTYQVRLQEKATSAGGVALKDALRLDLSTADSLGVAQVFPSNGTQGVAPDSVITVMFNRPVVPLRIAEEQKNLPQPLTFEPPLEGKGEWVNTSVYIYHPAQALKGNVAYKVTIAAGLADTSGASAPLPADFTWSFQTMSPSVDWLKIKVNDQKSVALGEENSSNNVSLNPEFSLHFFQPMERASTTAALALAPTGGGSLLLNLTWSEDNLSLTFTPSSRLALGTTYTVSLSTSALAVNGSPLGKAQQWVFNTVPHPAILSTAPSGGATNTDYQFEIRFASPMTIKSIQAHVTFDPPLPSDQNYWYDSDANRILFFGLKSSTNYQVQLLPGMEDLYGNAIEVGKTIRFRTRPQDPQAWLMMPDRAQFRAGTDEVFYTRFVNVSTATFSLYRLTFDQLVAMMKPGSTGYTGQSGDLLWKQTVNVESTQDKPELYKMPLGGSDGLTLAKGFYLVGMDAPGVNHSNTPFVDSRVLSIADSNLTLKIAPTEAMAWVTGLDDGAPLANVKVKFYDENSSLIGEVQTGADGLCKLSLPNRYPQGQYVQAVLDDGAHFAYADGNWGSGMSPSDFGVWEQYYESPQPEIVYVYTDRPIYRPGQPVYFKGILRKDDDLQYSLPDQGQVEVLIRSFETTVYDETLPVSDWGTFNANFTLDPEAALGSYSIEVKHPGDKNSLGWVGFNVAEYRRPEFQVRLDVAPADVLAGGEFSANLKADYYSGGGVSQADVQWTLRSEAFTFTPPAAFSRYNFSDIDRDAFDYRTPSKKTDNLLAEGKGKTDDQGRLTLTLPAKLKTDASQRLVLEVSVTDFAGMAVSGRAEVIAHRSAVYPGVRFDGYIGEAGKEQRIQLTALDWAGKPVAGQLVDVQVVERRWHSVQEQDERGNLKWSTTVEEIPVKDFKDVALDGEGKGSVVFTPPNGGIFKARVTARDSRGNQATASDMIWGAGQDFIPWRQTNDRSFQLVTDKTEYQPGETAEVLIASPFQGEAYALLTVERGKVRKQEVLKLESNSTLYKLPISADLAPNVYISVAVVKGVDANNPRPNFKVGIAEIKVSTSQQVLKVQVQADRPQAGPGEQVTYSVQTTGADGQPVQAEVSLGLSDLTTLSLAPPNSPAIDKGFYDRRGLRVRTSMALINSIEDYNANLADYERNLGQGAGSGGGKGEGDLGVVEVRQDFPDTAFWQADVRTGADGKAQVSVRLPDNLTTWRMDARAVTQDTRVGQTIADLVSSKPLLLRPQTPRFLVAGDKVTLGTAVHNNTAEDLKVEARLDGEGITIDGSAAQQIDVPAGQHVFVIWQAQVPADAQKADLTFSAKSTGASGTVYSDASKPTIGSAGKDGLPIYRYDAPETVATSGQLSEQGAVTEAILLTQSMPVTQGDLTVSVAPSLSASLTDGLSYLEHFPYECTEQTISRFLPNVLVTRVLHEAGLTDPSLEENLKAQVQLAMQRLANWQHEDGGWGWWKEGQGDEQITAYVVLGLLEARDAGYEVPELMLTNGRMYLNTHIELLTDSGDLDPAIKANRQAFILYVLSRGDRPYPALVSRLFDQRLKLDLYARAFLMRAISQQDANDPRLDTLRSDFANAAVISASGTHWEEAQADVWNWNSDTRTTAIVLGTLVKTDPQNKLVANAVRWLMSHRTEGRWGSTQETSWTLMALADWMRASGELKADYRYAVGLNDKPLAEGQASPKTIRQVQTLRVTVADLLKDAANKLVVAREAGQGNLYYTANLKVYLPVPQVQALDRGIIVSREYFRPEDSSAPVTQAAQGDLLRVRLTVIAPKALHYVVIDDPLPAGFEGVDTSLLISPQGEQPEAYRWSNVNETGWGWWYFNHIEMRDEKVVLSAGYLPAGTYVYTYLVRASTPGVFNVIPPTGQEFYFPEVYGRGDGMSFVVK
jgi:alpha-2-macroglobulin